MDACPASDPTVSMGGGTIRRLAARTTDMERQLRRCTWRCGRDTRKKKGSGAKEREARRSTRRRGRGNEGSEGVEQRDEDPDRRRVLLNYVQHVQTHSLDEFLKRAPKDVVDGMRDTVANMLGNLPPQFFHVNVRAVGENLAQLMCSVMMTGYMFRNAKYRKEMIESTHAQPTDKRSNPGKKYAPGIQRKDLQGHVLRWNLEQEKVENTPVSEYIDELERDIQTLKRHVEGMAKAGNKPEHNLLLYIKTLEPQNLQELTASAGEDVLDAMNAFVYRLMGTSDPEEMKSTSTENTNVEMARMLYWLMVVGYSLRTLEVRYDMERAMELPISPAPKGLPPGM